MKYTIYTSYFGNLKNIPLEKCMAVSRGIPDFYRGERWDLLAPPWYMARRDCKLTNDEWEREYYSKLEKLNPEEVAKKLDGRVILCWETPFQVCHRHYIINWLRQKGLDIESAEWGKGPVAKPVVRQDSFDF